MANKVEISAVLKRNLKEGKEYDKLIPRVKCERTNLGSGDTFDTVDWMKDWIEKFNYQTEKISTLFIGRSLEETVNNIYRFLYDHVQYTADGELQQLRSPACTWAQRKEGVDCKSYSVFASSILSNLGIKHFIRQVRQPYFFPEEFTHVYVVVPKDQNVKNYSENAPTFVLDATKHQNTEGSFIEKVDLQMTNLKHVGLNAPQDERTQRIIQNFENFSHFLLQKGASLASVNAIRERISYFTTKGIDPDITIVPEGLQINGVVFILEFTEHVPFLAVEQAFGGAKGLKFASAFDYNAGLGFSFSEAFSGASFTPTTTSTSTSTSGGSIVGDTLASAGIPFGDLIGNVLGGLKLDENISNILKYGLSSWGASATPEEMKKRFAELCYPWLKQMLTATTMDNVARQMTAIDVNLRGNGQFFKMLKENHSRAKSTRLANEWAEKECNRLIVETIDGFNALFQKNGIAVQRKTVGAKSSALSSYPITSFWDKKDIKKDRYWDDISYFIFEVDKNTLKSWNQSQMDQLAGSGDTPTGGSDLNPTGSGTGNLNDGSEESGNNKGLIIGGALALASLPLFFMKKSPTTSKPTNTRKAPVKRTKKASK